MGMMWRISRRWLSLSKEQNVNLIINRSLDHILQDWQTVLSKDQSPHDYSIYRKDLRMRIAPQTEPGGFSIQGRWLFKIVRPLVKIAIRYSIKSTGYNNPRLIIENLEPEGQIRSFKWRIESNATHPILMGMAHYHFCTEDGLVKSIQIDRLVPPLRSNLNILAYIRLLQQQLINPVAIEKVDRP